jgi:pimeloyl-ACP methyl ester carboxylesterase
MTPYTGKGQIMSRQSRWSTQPLDIWRERYANGTFINLAGHATHYVEKGEGAVAILLHGWFHDCQMWNRNIDALASRFTVYAIDLWGFGYSTREIMDWGYPLYADQLINFMDALGIDKASLVGQSMGAGTSILFCTRQPERVDKLVLVSPAGLPNYSPPIDAVALQRCLRKLILGLDDSRRLVLKTMFIYDESCIMGEYFEDLTRFHEIQGTNEALIGNLRNDFFDKLLPEISFLGEMETPTLIVLGRHDKSISPELGEKMQRILKGSRLEIIEESGHCPNYEQPARFNQIVVDFLGE